MISRVKSMSQDNEIKGQVEFDRRIAALEQHIAEKIEKYGQHDLNTLVRAGMKRKTLLRMLALVVDEEGEKTWAGLMRARQEALKSIARRMRTLARDAEKRARDPFSIVQTWFFLKAGGGELGMELPMPLADDQTFPFIIHGMRVLADRWAEQARKFGRFLKRYGDKRTNVRLPQFLCLICVWLHKRSPGHWSELASVLTDAFEAGGKKKSFSADWLQRVWNKRGKQMLRFWLTNIDIPPSTTTPFVSGSSRSKHARNSIPGLVD